ncbi:MAG: polysaccharide biosynthesis tyrosine autokinase [Deltaproteobacteria bacterium]|nr:polysaccharide biosynthesis tyrosine autokinase [Deltaproteobacteria bacterium]
MPKSYELEISDYWRIVKRRKLIVIATFLLVTVAIAIHSSRIPPTYEAIATIKIEKPISASTVDPTSAAWDVSDYIESQMQIINSKRVCHEAGVLAGLIKEGMLEQEIDPILDQFSGVKVTRRTQTNITDLAARATDPKQAALIANMVAKGYQAWSLKNHNEQASQVREYVGNLLKENEDQLNAKEQELKKFKEKNPTGSAIGVLQTQLNDMELKLITLLEKYTPKHPEVVELNAQIGALRSKLGEHPQLELTYSQLTRNIENLKTLNASLKQKYEDAKISEAQTISGVTVLQMAEVPDSPIAPNIAKNVGVGAVIALILGLLLAFVKENVDTSISTIEEVEDFLQVPVLGIIPEMVSNTSKDSWWHPLQFFQRITAKTEDVSLVEQRKRIVLMGKEQSFSSLEAYKTLRTNINFALAQQKGQVLEITSTGAKEGKSITSLNLSLSLAENGNKTCLISADLRRETVSRLMGVNKEPGLVDILTKDAKWQDVIRRTTDFLVGELPPDSILKTFGFDNFYLISSGKLPHNPSELLALDKMRALLQELRQHFDFVIIDTPPVLPVSDSTILAPQVDGVIMVYQVGKTARGALKRAKMQLLSTGANILGVILNNIKASEMKMAPTYYYYKEYYGPDEKKVRERRRRKTQENWWHRIISRVV